MSIYCLHCSSIISTKKKFCNSSCAAKYNNKGVRRHGTSPYLCEFCGEKTRSKDHKFCSRICFGQASKKSIEHQRAVNAERQGRYRSKKYRVVDSSADRAKIKSFYLACPEGYEVDHIIPLSRGGLHHENNLQYLIKEQNRRKGNRMVGDPGYDPSH